MVSTGLRFKASAWQVGSTAEYVESQPHSTLYFYQEE